MNDAILLVGPTSSGKTPLGDLIDASGLCGRDCAHFDFGARFRAAASSESPPAPLLEADIDVIRTAIATGALLTDGQFHIAHRILSAFAAESAGELIILNGMPRHEGQAKGIEDLVRVICVVELSCNAETVSERIRLDTGGDRAERSDDLPELVTRKLKVYEEQTRPLLGYYQESGVPVLTVDVTVVSTSADIKGLLDERLPEAARLESRDED